VLFLFLLLQWRQYMSLPDKANSSRGLLNVLSLALDGTPVTQQVGDEQSHEELGLSPCISDIFHTPLSTAAAAAAALRHNSCC